MRENVEVYAFDTVTGERQFKIPATSISWTDAVNEAGEYRIGVAWTREAAHLDLYERLQLWDTSLGIIRAGRILQAGPVTSRSWNPDTRKLDITGAGFWQLLDHRLALNPDLRTKWKDGEVLIDEANPPKAWALTLEGNLASIAEQLLAACLEWGALPLRLPHLPKGSGNTRTFLAPDLATVGERLTDLTELDDGITVWFEPELTETGGLQWQARINRAGVTHRLHEGLGSGVRVKLGGWRESFDHRASKVFIVGGRENDLVLVGHAGNLEDVNGLQMHTSNKEHTTVSDLATLQSWAQRIRKEAESSLETWTVETDLDEHILPGDNVLLVVDEPFLGSREQFLAVMAVSGNETGWVKLSTVRI